MVRSRAALASKRSAADAADGVMWSDMAGVRGVVVSAIISSLVPCLRDLVRSEENTPVFKRSVFLLIKQWIYCSTFSSYQYDRLF